MVGKVKESKQQEEAKVIVWSDSNWAAPKSTSGWLISWNGCTLQTAAKTQSSPALSSAEAEIIAGCEAAKEGRFAANLLAEIDGREVELELQCDASSAIAFAQRPGLGRVKHLNLRHLWVQEEVLAGRMKIVKIATESNRADLVTKNLSLTEFMMARWAAGLRGPEEEEEQ